MASFGPSRIVSDGNSTLDHPKGATMPSTRFAVPVLAVLLLAGACGGDDLDPEAGDTEIVATETGAVSTGAEDDVTEGVATTEGGSAPEPDPTSEATTAAEADPAPVSEPADATEVAVSEPTPEPEAPSVVIGAVELGDRFPWCARVNAIWQDFDEAAEFLGYMTIGLEEAQQALATATDELDVIEAETAEGLAQRAYDEVSETYAEAYENLSNYMLATRLYLDYQLFVSSAAVNIDGLIRDDEEFFAQYYSRTQEDIDENVANRMSRYLEILNAEIGAALFPRYGRTRRTSDPWDESEIVAMGRAWEAFDTVVGDEPAFEMFKLNAGFWYALGVYGLAHGKHADPFLEENRPATRLRFSLMEELKPKAEQAEQDIMAIFISNDEARAAYEQSYAESCQG